MSSFPRTDDHSTIPNAIPIPTPASNTISTTTPSSTSISIFAKIEKEKKFKLASNQIIDASTIGEKVMNTTVELPINHILAIASDVTEYIHDMTRKRRVSISTLNDAMAMQSTTSSAPNVTAKVNSATTKTFMHVPRGVLKSFSISGSTPMAFSITGRRHS